ncbi:TniQ family protein [Dechloromonas denitrificans]|uniref:TniQ family protein n=1 Tax=Dechloromonas denitrificans TaxID=281362 RepID=UPI001CFBA8DE|nr:TniQ family protein [Dechloromonas denitrificans]UCV09420.1 TniQ family protein [Dechloromonas denitrificans]
MAASNLYFVPEYPGFADGHALPPRSRLFALEPISVGTAAAEGMTSYVIRLAGAYSINPRRLILQEFAKLSPGLAKYRRHGLFFQTEARSINGLHQHSQSFSDAVEKLCGIRNAKNLTLLNLQGLLPFNGPGLIAAHPRWCPACYREWIDFRWDAYHPLAWSFDLYRVCPKHGTTLLDRCPCCNEYQHVIPRVPVLGFCCHCGTWLGQGKAEDRSRDDTDIWLATAIEDIVAELPALSALAIRDHFVSQLNQAIDHFAGGSRRRFCIEIGLPANTLQPWLSGNQKPTLPRWLTIAYGLAVSPVEFLKMDFVPGKSQGTLRKLNQQFKPRFKRPTLTKVQREAIEAELRKEALCGDGSVPVATIAEKHGLARTYLRVLWPDLCQTIRDARRAKLMTLAKEEQLRKYQIVREIVDSFLGQGIYPSRRILSAALDKIGISYADPEIRRIHKQRLTANGIAIS